ncbi:hypothetical protein AMTR_s00042p00174870 [Amborella trichopoda]|uniref:Uncharacterized protein n=1 Tax=Amborella trichopoda TaxID=13333 RepID=W1P172_AMBTC|nr:hypothetical protein AMTR_s00042p00174870 [Amborella trichopoda]
MDDANSIGISLKRPRRACTLRGVRRKGLPLPNPPAHDQVDDFIEGSIPLADVLVGETYGAGGVGDAVTSVGSARIERVTGETESLGDDHDIPAEAEGEVPVEVEEGVIGIRESSVLTTITLAMLRLQWCIGKQFEVFLCTFLVPFYFLTFPRATPCSVGLDHSGRQVSPSCSMGFGYFSLPPFGFVGGRPWDFILIEGS